ncbi:sensor histidine kinase [Peribacillus alkalitolerans]|uniref:sensor histidine kinase n=1 Tax=Peribacillus alkalitolerans TaxID=1550385 RepID=UPI0013D02A5C|nr:HAMP domain-containing sensor histidine kinase [Peribacillus alkalitolerans]
MIITKHFFFTLSLLLVLLILGLIWYERKKNLQTAKWLFILYSITTLLICLQSSYQPTPYFHFDLRMVPVVIGSLYLGIGPILAVLTILIRGMHGLDIGFYLNFILYGTLAVFFWRFHPRFLKQSPKKRIYSSVIIAVTISILTAAMLIPVISIREMFDAVFAYLVVPPIGIWLISYFIEFVIRNQSMHKQLIRAEKLQAIEQMGAAISHEIRNPLTAALGFVQLLLEDHHGKAKKNEYLRIVKEELESAESVIQDYLSFSKPSLERLENINIKTEIKKIISVLQPMANQYSIEISLNSSIIGTIAGDRQKFHQCFLNIIKNAIESMPDGGKLLITTEYHHTHNTIRVEDTGYGMSKDQMQRLGEPYYTTKGSKGTGLGMMVAYGIIRAMNGTIHVESEIGKGTVFLVEFPRGMG